MISGKKYRLSSGTQVRQEDFGLLFYTMRGPRLYFLSLKDLLEPCFFTGECSLKQWVEQKSNTSYISDHNIEKIDKSLGRLIDKGVILEC